MQPSEVGLRHSEAEAYRRLARVAVEVGGDQEGRGAEGIAGGQRRALPVGEQVARGEARPPLRDPVGVGERQRRSGREAPARTGRRQPPQPPRLVADRAERRVAAAERVEPEPERPRRGACARAAGAPAAGRARARAR